MSSTAHAEKHEPTFRADVLDTRGDTIAVVHRTLPVRRQSAAPHAPRGGAA
jgi:hypothetical protein